MKSNKIEFCLYFCICVRPILWVPRASERDAKALFKPIYRLYGAPGQGCPPGSAGLVVNHES